MIDRLIKRHLCFECGSDKNIHYHHVVPKSKGGTQMIPLCANHHSIVHNFKGLKKIKSKKGNKPYYAPGSGEWNVLQKEGIKRTQQLYPERYSGRKRRSSEGTLKFLEKHSEAVKYLEMGMKCVEISKLCNVSLNTLTKIKKTINKK